MEERLPILVLQNTWYHFETTLSIYQILEDAGYMPYVFRCTPDPDKFGQEKFLKRIGARIATKDAMRDAAAAVVISAYPNPKVVSAEAVPYAENCLSRYLRNKVLYISHRFGNRLDYEVNPYGICEENTFCLSPLASKIGLDHLFFVKTPVKPVALEWKKPIWLTVQGHFEIENRMLGWLALITKDWQYEDVIIQLVGTGADRIGAAAFHGRKNVEIFSDLPEREFYSRVNGHTHFLLPLIDPDMKNQTYGQERYSSNFNVAWAMEKPVLCHEAFKDVYGLPGFYYNYDNFNERVSKLLRTTADTYADMLTHMRAEKERYHAVNVEKMRRKLGAIIAAAQ